MLIVDGSKVGNWQEKAVRETEKGTGKKIKQHRGVTGKEAVNRVGMGSLRKFR